MQHLHTKLTCQKPMLRQVKWEVQDGPITKNGISYKTRNQPKPAKTTHNQPKPPKLAKTTQNCPKPSELSKNYPNKRRFCAVVHL